MGHELQWNLHRVGPLRLHRLIRAWLCINSDVHTDVPQTLLVPRPTLQSDSPKVKLFGLHTTDSLDRSSTSNRLLSRSSLRRPALAHILDMYGISSCQHFVQVRSINICHHRGTGITIILSSFMIFPYSPHSIHFSLLLFFFLLLLRSASYLINREQLWNSIPGLCFFPGLRGGSQGHPSTVINLKSAPSPPEDQSSDRPPERLIKLYARSL